jgi:hypothetical protein
MRMSPTWETSSIVFANAAIFRFTEHMTNPFLKTETTAHPGNRWRIFAVAACGGAVRGQQDAALYVERLRARRAQFPIPAYRRKVQPQMSAFRENRVVQSFL